MLLNISNLNVNIKHNKIINCLDLSVKEGEVHAIMGPNGTGKSTLVNTICGRNEHKIIDGKILFFNQSIKTLSCDQRARLGIFMSFQHPVEIPGVNCNNFLRSSINAIRKEQKLKDITPIKLNRLIKEKANLLDIDCKLLKRDVNHGFSGGEKKKFEILQMLLLNPKIAILDEIDSGLDIDSLRIISKNINIFRNKKKSIIIITHYNRIFNYVTPDIVHIFNNGKIIRSGDVGLAKEVESKGYNNFK